MYLKVWIELHQHCFKVSGHVLRNLKPVVMFGDKHFIPIGPAERYVIPLEDYRKATYPIPITNSWSLVLGSVALFLKPALNYSQRKPLLAGKKCVHCYTSG